MRWLNSCKKDEPNGLALDRFSPERDDGSLKFRQDTYTKFFSVWILSTPDISEDTEDDSRRKIQCLEAEMTGRIFSESLYFKEIRQSRPDVERLSRDDR